GGTDDFVDEIMSALDATFTGGTGEAPDLSISPAAQDAQVHQESVEALVDEIAGTYAKPIRDFIVELQRGNATTDWFEICLPSLKSIGQAARQMHFVRAAERINDLEVVMKQVLQSRE